MICISNKLCVKAAKFTIEGFVCMPAAAPHCELQLLQFWRTTRSAKAWAGASTTTANRWRTSYIPDVAGLRDERRAAQDAVRISLAGCDSHDRLPDIRRQPMPARDKLPGRNQCRQCADRGEVCRRKCRAAKQLVDFGTRVQFPPPPLQEPLAIRREWPFFLRVVGKPATAVPSIDGSCGRVSSAVAPG